MRFLLCTTLRNRVESIVLFLGKYFSVLNGRFERGKVYLREGDRRQITVRTLTTHLSLNTNTSASPLSTLYLSIHHSIHTYHIYVGRAIDRYIVIIKNKKPPLPCSFKVFIVLRTLQEISQKMEFISMWELRLQ